MANNNKPSSKKAFTANQICMHLIADCKPTYRPTRVVNEVKRDDSYDKYEDYEREQRIAEEAEAERLREEELNARYLLEQEDNEKLERESRIFDLNQSHSILYPITDNDELDKVEREAKYSDMFDF